MKIEIYLDSLFFLNLMINMGILRLLQHKFSLEQSGLRMFAAAVLGAATYIGLFLVPVKTFLWQLAAMAGSLPVMVCIILPRRKRRFWAGMIGWGMAYSFIIAGVLRAVLFKWQLFSGREITLFSVLLGVFVCVRVGLWYLQKQRENRHKSLCKVILESAGTKIEVVALVDTGNSLTEPLSHKPVCLIEEDLLAKITLENPLFLRAIPFRSVGCEHGMLYGVLVPKITILSEEKTIVATDVICAGVGHRLSSKNVYQMILHPALVSEYESKMNLEVKECY